MPSPAEDYHTNDYPDEEDDDGNEYFGVEAYEEDDDDDESFEKVFNSGYSSQKLSSYGGDGDTDVDDADADNIKPRRRRAVKYRMSGNRRADPDDEEYDLGEYDSDSLDGDDAGVQELIRKGLERGVWGLGSGEVSGGQVGDDDDSDEEMS